MRPAAIGLFVLLPAFAAASEPDCRTERFRAFPPSGATVPPNVQFRFFAFPEASKLAGAMMKSTLTELVPASVPREALFVPRGQQVQVRRVGSGLSPQHESMALFRPETPVPQGPQRFGTLPVGTSYYTLLAPMQWTVAGPDDVVPPALEGPVTGRGRCSGSKRQRRCTVTLDAVPGEPVVAELRLSRRGFEWKRQWPVEAGRAIEMEAGPCGGEARDLGAGRYDAALRLIDSAGNAGASVTFPLTLSDGAR